MGVIEGNGAAASDTKDVGVGSDYSIGIAHVENSKSRTSGKTWLRENVKQPVDEAWQRYILEGVFRQKPLPPTKDGRHVPLDTAREEPLVDERRGQAYISNSIRSSRYTIWDFLPKQLWFQLTRLANFYFLCVGVPQTIPGLSTTGNFTTILPLMFFVLLTIVKEGYDDYRRSRLDIVENNKFAFVLGKQSAGVLKVERKWAWLAKVPWVSRFAPETPVMPGHDSDEDGLYCWNIVRWQDIQVGDVTKLRRDDPIPADITLLYADTEDNVAFIETMALDGETNLKGKQAPSATRSASNIAGVKALNLEAVIEDPNRDLYNFDGRLIIDGHQSPLTLADVAFRGSVLRNTPYAIGLVVNTGEECKIRMNANHHPTAKKPRLERYANQVVLTLIFYVVVQSIGVSMGYLMWHRRTEQHSWYISNAPVGFEEIIIGFLIMFNNVIPLALYISLEIVKIGQQIMISSDVEMYDEESQEPMRANTNTILENLGQIGYILSDKTGTLESISKSGNTQNVMKFRQVSIAGTVWSHKSHKIHGAENQSDPMTIENEPKGTAKNSKTSVEVTKISVPSSSSSALRPPVARRSSSRPRPSTSNPDQDFDTTQLIEYINSRPDSAFSRKARNYILGMALCHTCLPEVQEDGSVDYQAASPDELALARAAQELGFSVVHRTSQTITLSKRGAQGAATRETYEILDVIEFSSKRKRMSIILRCPDGKIWLICKGADSALVPRFKQAGLAGRKSREVRRSVEAEREMQRRSIQLERRSGLGERPSMAIERIRKSMDLRPSIDTARSRGRRMQPSPDRLRVPSFDTRHTRTKFDVLESPAVMDDADVFARCFKHLDEFATDGLRTLVYAHKMISGSEYVAWKKQYLEATTSLVDRQNRIEAAAELMEQDLDLLGASAIEDKLQDGVPETIDKLRRANIRIWMLTGDKRETAINIAHSAQICRPESHICILDSTQGDLNGQLQVAAADHVPGSVHSVAVIDGHTLSVVEDDLALKEAFYTLIFRAFDSVICCRASPAQKASIVTAIPHYVPNTLTLAIGDGANDIAMIQAAHVGVGISGKEGLQASRVADYSIAQFRFLQRLLLVHGRWNYLRTAKFVLWTFWKEMLFYMPQALYQRYNGYTGTSLYENWSLTALNTLFTSLCVIVPGMFEQDLSAKTLLAVPELYALGQRNCGLNWGKFLRWTANGAAEGMVLWFVPWAVYGKSGGVMNDHGLFALGDLVFSGAILWTNLKLLLLETHNKTLIVFCSFAITTSGWWAWNAFLSAAYSDNISPYDVKGGFEKTFGNDPLWWATLALTLTLLVMVEMAIKGGRTVLGKIVLLRKKSRTGEIDAEVRVWQQLEREGLVGQQSSALEDGDEAFPVDKGKSSVRLDEPEGSGWSSAREEVTLGAKRDDDDSGQPKVRVTSIELRRL